MINAGLTAIGAAVDAGTASSPDEVDMTFLHASGAGSGASPFPRHHGGPFFWAERFVGLRDVNLRLKELHEEQPGHKDYEPSPVLVQVVQSSSTIREDLFIRAQSQK